MHYILTWTRDSIELVGPFTSDDEASLWAVQSRNNPRDTPCWQVVDLPPTAGWIEEGPGSITGLVIGVRTPDSGPLRDL